MSVTGILTATAVVGVVGIFVGLFLEGLGDVIVLQLLPDSRQDHDGDGEAHRGGEAVDDAGENPVLLLHIGNRHAQYRAVGGN